MQFSQSCAYWRLNLRSILYISKISSNKTKTSVPFLSNCCSLAKQTTHEAFFPKNRESQGPLTEEQTSIVSRATAQ